MPQITLSALSLEDYDLTPRVCTSSDHSGHFSIGSRLQDRLPFPG